MIKLDEKVASKTFIWALFLPMLLSFALVTIYSFFYSDVEILKTKLIYIIPMMLVSQIAFLIIYLVFVKKHNISIKLELKKTKMALKLKNVLWCVLISLIAVFGLIYFVGLFDTIFQNWGYVEEPSAFACTTFIRFFISVIIAAVIPAIMEELVFRGIIFKGLKQKGYWFAIVVSSVMFFIVHLSLSSIIYPLIMGIIFCFIVQKTGNVVYSIIVHFCNNFLVLLIQYLQYAINKQIIFTIDLWWEVLLVIIVAMLSLVTIWYIIKHCLNTNQSVREKELQSLNIEEINEKQYKEINESSLEKTETNKVVCYIKNRKISFIAIGIGLLFWTIVIISSF